MPLAEPVPDIRSLDLLRSVAELGSIRQAAGAHHISQPAASMRLRSLERTLDLELLDRSSGRARLTGAGRAVVQWSEAVLEGMRDLLLGTAAVRSEGRGNLRIAASMTVAEYLVPGWLSRLRASDPDVAVSLQMGNSGHVAETMRVGGADIGFVEGPDDPPDLHTRVVAGDDLVVVLASTTAIKASVAAGTGPGVLSRLAVEPEVADGRIVVVPTSGIRLERLIRAIWSSERPLMPAATRLLRQLRESAGER